MEEKLGELYNEIANSIISAIPVEWEDIYYLGEVEKNKKSWSSVFFFKDINKQQYVKSHDIPQIYGVSESEYRDIMNNINSILLRLYDCFIENSQCVWEQLSLSIKNTGEFNIDYMYDKLKNSKMGQVGREVVWAYETFGRIPKEGTYMRKILEEYLSK